MRFLVLDFETFDPYIDLGLGGGWAYKLNVPTSQFRTIGFSYCWIDTAFINHGEMTFTSKSAYKSTKEFAKSILSELLEENCDGIVMHNAQYDLGCLLTLGIEVNVPVYDTKIIAHLYDNTLMSYSLDSLSKLYLKKDSQKATDVLIDYVIDAGLASELKPKKEGYNVERYRKRIKDWCYTHMDVIQASSFEVMAEYANHDTQATAGLFLHFLKTVPIEQAEYWSSVAKICVNIRRKGIKIDLDVLKSTIPLLLHEKQELKDKISCRFNGESVDIDSPKQLAAALIKLGYHLPKTPAGGDSTSTKWLDEHPDDEFLMTIKEYRSTTIILRDFFEKPLEWQQYTCPEALIEGAKYGRVFPELNIFGASTGRFSSSCPNIQNIPRRHPKWGKICRSLFVPDDQDKLWIKADWANQEGRLQVHYASLINAPKIDYLVKRFKENPNLNLHQETADIAQIKKAEAKPINLGLSYGMGDGLLAKNLHLPYTEHVHASGNRYCKAGKEALAILDKYHRAMPHVNYLIKDAACRVNKIGYIKTIDGRILRKGKYDRDNKPVSNLIQGSALDLMVRALKASVDAGLDIKCTVHDELCIEGTEEDAVKLKNIMETTPNLVIPMIAEIEIGSSWGTTVEFKIGDLLNF
jgi:DNA polymerase I-like protein with 3'-5' exonuclease and polymerase domains